MVHVSVKELSFDFKANNAGELANDLGLAGALGTKEAEVGAGKVRDEHGGEERTMVGREENLREQDENRAPKKRSRGSNEGKRRRTLC